MAEAETKKRLPNPKPLGALLPRVRPHAIQLAGAFFCLLLSVGIALAFPQIVRRLLDAAFVSGDRTRLDDITQLRASLSAHDDLRANHRRAEARFVRASGAIVAWIFYRAANRRADESPLGRYRRVANGDQLQPLGVRAAVVVLDRRGGTADDDASETCSDDASGGPDRDWCSIHFRKDAAARQHRRSGSHCRSDWNC